MDITIEEQFKKNFGKFKGYLCCGVVETRLILILLKTASPEQFPKEYLDLEGNKWIVEILQEGVDWD